MLARYARVVCTVLSIAPVGPLDAPGRITRASDMQAPRAAHRATALADGAVLITGGFTEGGRPVTAELYDARRRRSRPLTMQLARHSHTATLLPDGRVLITGGYVADNAITSSVELFDLRTGRFSPAGALSVPRAGHEAVPLPDGRVLLVGGVSTDWTFLASAELYDPRTGRVTATGSMREPRESHVAVTLADGRVLVIGGHAGPRRALRLHATTELFDPTTGRFAPGPTLRQRRHKHDALRLRDGRVLVIGGSDERDGDGAYRATEVLDPSRGRFVEGPALVAPRYKLAGTSVQLEDGSVLVAGGHARAERCEVDTRACVAVPQVEGMAGQFAATAALEDGRVLITGGYGSGTGPRRAIWVYDRR